MMVWHFATILRENVLNIVSIKRTECSTWLFQLLVTKDLDNSPVGILTEKAIFLEDNHKKQNKKQNRPERDRPERECSVLLSASLDTQGESIGALVLAKLMNNSQHTHRKGGLSDMRAPHCIPVAPYLSQSAVSPFVFQQPHSE